ncbi:MAG: glycosyltransferase family 4 protein [Candidatus Acidiferrales bacterium]
MATKVCVMTAAHPPCDVRIFHKQCRSLAQAGYEVTLIAPGTERVIREGVHLEPMPLWSSRASRMVRGAWMMYQKARRQKADVYHFHDPELIPVGVLLRLAGKRVIYDVHEDLPNTISYKSYVPRHLRWLVSRIAAVIEGLGSRCFTAIVVANPTGAGRFRARNGQVMVVSNYPRIEEIERAGSGDTGAAAGDGFLLYVGARITRARGAREMVQAMGLLPSSMPVQLKLAGGWDPPDLRAELSRIPGWERVRYVGWLGREELAQVLHQARAGLVVLHPEPNYLTAQPVKLFEYMCAGLPVIASDFPVNREVIETAGCGLLVNPLDPEEIACAIQYLWTHPQQATEMGRRGQQAVRERFNWANEERALLELYGRVCKGEPAIGAEPVALR